MYSGAYTKRPEEQALLVSGAGQRHQRHSDQHHNVAVHRRNIVDGYQLQRLGQCLGYQKAVERVTVVERKL